MKIVHILWTGRIGGAEQLVLDICSNGNESRNNKVLFLRSGGEMEQEIGKIVETKVFKVKDGIDIIHSLEVLIYLFHQQFDLIHFHTTNCLVLFFSLIFFKEKTIYTEHGAGISPFEDPSSLKMRVVRFSIRKVKHIIAISHFVKDELIKKNNVDGDRIDVIYNFIDEKRFIKKKNIVSEKLNIAFVGRLTHQKGLEYFLEVVYKLKDNNGINFFIVGDGELREYVVEQIKEKNLVNLRYEGMRRDIPQILSKMNIVFCSSRHEPFGIVILEAMASQNVVIAFDIDGIKEIIDNEINGYLVQSFDTDKVCSIIKELADNPGKMDIIGQNARIHVENKYSKDYLLNCYCDYYARLRPE